MLKNAAEKLRNKVTMSLFRLFLLFVKIGAILLGGGYVILPVMKAEFVEKNKLISEDDLVDYFAISQSLPGIIAANISIFVGYKLRRTIGAIVAVIGVTFAPFWSIVLLASLIGRYLHTTVMQGIFWGVGIGVMVLMISATREMWAKAFEDKFAYLIFAAGLGVMLFTKISPVWVVISSAVIGVIYKRLTSGRIKE